MHSREIISVVSMKTVWELIGILNWRWHGITRLQIKAALWPKGTSDDCTKLGSEYSRITAETGVTEMEKYFQDIKEEVYIGDLEVPSAEPVLDYLDSLPDGVMNKVQRKMALDIVEKEIGERGNFTVHNSRSLFIAIKP